MNAAFLIVTSACLTGAEPVPLLAPAPPSAVAVADKPPGASAPVAYPAQSAPVIAQSSCGSCGSNCAQWCECPGLFSRWKASWSHHGCDTCNTCAPAPKVHVAPCATCDTCAKPSFFDRWKARCAPSGCATGCNTGCATGCNTGCASGCASGGTVVPGVAVPAKPGEPLKLMPKEGEPKKLPEGKEAAFTPELTPTTSKTIEVETKSPFELSRRFENRVDHAADYSQLTGQLYFVHADGGLWVLRYAPLGTEDRFGGGVILARDRSMDSYREGDLVTVRGEILQERASRYLGAPLYRTSSIQLVERGE